MLPQNAPSLPARLPPGGSLHEARGGTPLSCMTHASRRRRGHKALTARDRRLPYAGGRPSGL